MTDKLHILLTGGTGFLGYRTLESLLARKDVEKVIATGRTLKPHQSLEHPKLNYVLGDLEDPAFVEDLPSAVNVIVHCAALSSPWGKAEDFESANLTTQKNLIKKAEAIGVHRYVNISTPAMYFDFNDRLNIKESDPLPEQLINEYARTKRLAEIELERSSLNYVSLRPRALIGRGDTVIMPRLIRAHNEGRLKVIGKGNNVVDLTPVDNVVLAINKAIDSDENAINQVYNISNGDPVVLWDKIELVLSKLGHELNRKAVPYGLADFVGRLYELKAKLGGMKKEPTFTRYSMGVLAKSVTMDIDKARRLLKYEPQVSVDEAIEDFINWYKTIDEA